jgi:hypothetical protein
LPRFHFPQLRFFEIRGDPHILQWYHHQQALALLHDLPGLYLFLRNHSVHRSYDVGVAQI